MGYEHGGLSYWSSMGYGSGATWYYYLDYGWYSMFYAFSAFYP